MAGFEARGAWSGAAGCRDAWSVGSPPTPKIRNIVSQELARFVCVCVCVCLGVGGDPTPIVGGGSRGGTIYDNDKLLDSHIHLFRVDTPEY